MKKIILIQLVIAAIIIGGYFAYIKMTPKSVELERKSSYLRITNLKNEYINKPVPDSLFIITEEKINLTNPKLIFRFSQIYCDTCVTREIRLLREYAKEIGWENIIFITTNSDEKFLNRFQRVSQVKTPINNVSYDFFEIDKESLDTPYMFILDSDSTFKELFISMKENEVRTTQYLDKINKEYF